MEEASSTTDSCRPGLTHPAPNALINYGLLETFPIETFRNTAPFPWFEAHQFLTPEGFEALRQSFPNLELFERHYGMERPYGQRPHNRYYLAYQESIYHQTERSIKRAIQGVVKHEELSPAWQSFLKELETSEAYRKLIESMFEVSQFEIRFAWHLGFTNCEVSPHVDATKKIGTQMIYFNTQEDWKFEWGGSTLVLGDKSTNAMNPDFTDFGDTIQIPPVGNNSLIFKNTANAWHGMQHLTCPEGKYRRLFNIIFDVPERRRKTPVLSPGRSLLKKIFG
jgi:hypothetical protein